MKPFSEAEIPRFLDPDTLQLYERAKAGATHQVMAILSPSWFSANLNRTNIEFSLPRETAVSSYKYAHQIIRINKTVSQKLPRRSISQPTKVKQEVSQFQNGGFEDVFPPRQPPKQVNFRDQEKIIKEKFILNAINEKSIAGEAVKRKPPLTKRHSMSSTRKESVLKKARRGQDQPEIQTQSDLRIFLQIFFYSLYLLISFGILGLTLFLILTKTSNATPPLFKYTLFVICFSIVIFPVIILSRHKASIIFIGILVVIFLSASALAVVLAMAPLTSCGDMSYVQAHALTDGVQLRCQLVQAECALLWLGKRPAQYSFDDVDLLAFVPCTILAFTGVKHYSIETVSITWRIRWTSWIEPSKDGGSWKQRNGWDVVSIEGCNEMHI